MTNMTLPKQIDPCPIQEAVVEIRFDSELPSDAIFGVVYSALQNSYKTVEKLPILQLPEAVRNNDENLIFQPHYKINRDKFTVQIGPRMFSLSVIKDYTTWEEYLEEILTVFGKIGNIGFISNVSRFGLRYVNLFKDDILKNLNLKLKIIENQIENDEVLIRTVFPKEENFKILLQIINHAPLKKNINSDEKVSIIDIDAIMENGNINFFEDISNLLEKGHQLQKEMFFGLLKSDFLESLSPTY